MKALGLEDQPTPKKGTCKPSQFPCVFEHGSYALTEFKIWRWLLPIRTPTPIN